jgi:predicted aminopeptidase
MAAENGYPIKSHRVENFRKILGLSSVAMAIFLFTGCSTISYLAQATAGHLRIMHSRVPIEEMLNGNQVSSEHKEKLKIVLEVRAFAASELDLPDNESYTVYSRIDGAQVGWNVFVAPRFSVEPITWCFPLAGCVVYHGFFSEEKAFRFAKKTEKKDLDVFVLPFDGYSTLGWWNDPVLSTQLMLDTVRLAGVVIHELAHQRFYLSGDSCFNEAFAVTVERAGILKWLKASGRDALVPHVLGRWRQDDLKASITLQVRNQLMLLYRTESDFEILRREKNTALQSLKVELQRECGEGANSSRICASDFAPNNAYFIPVDTYYSLVPVFQEILESCGGNLPQFYRKMEELGKLPFEKRNQMVELLKKESALK